MINNKNNTNCSIINISSIAAKYGTKLTCHYSASKAGVEGFTKIVAREMASHNIRCNVVIPGSIETPMTANVPAEGFI
jgi:NAD(P)-dependent dehydrogenase (short-subunit alcohol dehydrogenase family)